MAVLVEPGDDPVSCGHLSDSVVRIEKDPANQYRARDRQQTITDAAHRAAVALTAFAQFGIAKPGALVALRGNGRSVIEGTARDKLGVSRQRSVWSPRRRRTRSAGHDSLVGAEARLGEQRGEDDPFDAGQGSQDRHLALLAPLPRGIVCFI